MASSGRASTRVGARRVVGRLSRRLPAPWVRSAGRLVRLVQGRPTVSVVVPVTDDTAPLLASCVEAALRPPAPVDELLLVAAVASPSSRRTVAAQAAASRRVRVVWLPGGSAAAAMTAGAARASGRLLAFVSPGDELDPDGLAAAAGILAGDDADVVGGTGRDLGRVALGDILVRRSLWRRASLTVPDAPHGQWWAAARVLLAARRAVPGPALRSRSGREAGVSFGTMPCLAPHVGAWWPAVEQLLGDLEDRDAGARADVLRWLLDEELPRYLEDAERCTPDEWAIMSAASRQLLRAAPRGSVAELGVESRARVMLAAGGHRRHLETYNAQRWLAEGQFPTRVEHGQVFAELPLPPDLLDPQVFALGAADSALVCHLRTMRWTDGGQLELDLYAFIRGVSSDAGEPSARFWLARGAGGRTALAATRHDDDDVNLMAGERFTDHRRNAFTVRLDAADLLRGAAAGDRWQVTVELSQAGVTRSGGLTSVHLQGGASGLPAAHTGGLTLRPRRAPGDDGRWQLAVEAPDEAAAASGDWLVTEVELEATELVVRGTAGGAGPDAAHDAVMRLRGPAVGDASPVVVDGDRFECRLALDHQPWQLPRRALPAGGYRLRLDRPLRDGRRLRMSTELAGRTPYTRRSVVHRARVQRHGDGGVLVNLAAPLAEEEMGAFGQQQLRRWYASDEHRLDPDAVYLQSYTGAAATDSPLAIHRALRTLRPDLQLLWAVADRSTVVPEGARPLLMRSREWYAALARSRYLVTNVDMDTWFVKRPGQRLLQTYHGYPSKTMGLAAWRAKNFTPLRVERQLARTSGTWDLLLTPTPAMDVHYRREYRYEGEILATGYPRDDVLVGPEAGRIRADTRTRLGVGDGQRVVLYAPTWRDDLATNFRAAAMPATFDVEAAAAALGDGFVLLLRGHRFHRRRPVVGGRILDVTDYPEVNDLVLAADAAVLDYSSLRFDFALTGRPMVFLVPDLDRYATGVRGFLFDFRSSAPGPLVSSTHEVVERLRDVDALTRACQADLDRFNSEFNPLQDGHAAARVVDAFFGPPHDTP